MPNPSTFQIGGVTCKVFAGDNDGQGAVDESWSMGSPPKAVAKIKCAYADRYTMFRGLVGSISISGTTIIRNPPFQYPPSPGLICTEISSCIGIGRMATDSTGWATWPAAIVTCVFSYPGFSTDSGSPAGQGDPTGQAYTTTRTRTSGEVFTPEGGTFFWNGGSDNGKQVSESSIGLVRPRTEISITRHMLPVMNLNFLESYIGSVNANPIPIGNYTYGTGTILFAGFSTEPSADVTGAPAQEVEYTLLANGNGQDWNQLIDRDYTFQFVSTNKLGGGTKPFEYKDWWSVMP
jgi:hypothetical protein